MPIAPPFPAVLHADVSGVIEVMGERVNDFKIGDEVFTCAGGLGCYQGALAEYMVVDAALAARKPATRSLVDAAVLLLVSITAWETLINKLALHSGDRILIHGATGGVGHVAVQLAKRCGACVVTISGRSQIDLQPAFSKGLSLHTVFMLIPLLHGRGREEHGGILRRIASLVDDGVLRPVIDLRRFNFSEIAQAHGYHESGAARGKISLISDLS